MVLNHDGGKGSSIKNFTEFSESKLYFKSYFKTTEKAQISAVFNMTPGLSKVPNWFFEKSPISLKLHEHIGLTTTALIKRL